MNATAQPTAARNATLLIAAAAAVMLITTGARQVSGLFLLPIMSSTGVSIASISLALAIGQFVWGAMQPIFGALADSFGAYRVVVFGALLMAAGSILTAFSDSGADPHRNDGRTERGRCGSGQLLDSHRWDGASALAPAEIDRCRHHQRRRFARTVRVRPDRAGSHRCVGMGSSDVHAGRRRTHDNRAGVAAADRRSDDVAAATAPAATASTPADDTSSGITLRQQLRVATRDRNYIYLNLGFFTCGFHVAFLVTHLPGEIQNCGLAPGVAANSLAIIGLFNVIGSVGAGILGQRYRMKHLLALIYGSRAAMIAIYLLMPKTAVNLYIFAAGMGMTWLATVPPTSGIVSKLYGVRFLGTLFGLTLVSHQTGAFLGAWLGGVAMAQLHSYQWIWFADMALAVGAALINLPIREDKPLPRPVAQAG